MTTIGQKIKQVRTAAGLTQVAFASAVGVDQSTVSRWERDRQEPDPDQLLALAQFSNEPMENFIQLIKDDGVGLRSIYVTGVCETNRWVRGVERPTKEWYRISIPPNGLPETVQPFGLEVNDTGADLEFPPGSIAICIAVADMPGRPEPGDWVVVRAQRDDSLVELTIREMRLDALGQRWLWPKSSDPRCQQPIALEGTPDPAGTRVEIHAVIIGSYKSYLTRRW